MKRLCDLIFGLFFLLCSSPVILFAALLVYFFDGTPVFYSQEREGKGGKKFRMYKIRTMKTNTSDEFERHIMNVREAKEEWERRFKLKNDPRVIPVIGNFLRSSSIDELPQFWNVIRGEMSIVGPRPLPFYHLEKFGENFRSLRRTVKPGVTGLWQVVARENDDVAVMEALDREYIAKRSFWYDMGILFKTPFHVLFRKGRSL